ncbi:hypothetical protein SBRY_20015 [Actinacidiphila bryophytorum]|uniref:Uncharacterized protein n=1 Tax=Actinacidiphila bryophytorum TaxID=1436133 RepID=A0A9W4EDJ5_9ACTN|nr:hypothetical protein SBRY_20015 [Actinacidiphila bryophytorum]
MWGRAITTPGARGTARPARAGGKKATHRKGQDLGGAGNGAASYDGAEVERVPQGGGWREPGGAGGVRL